MAWGASCSGKVREMSGMGSTLPERSSAMALAKGPQREPTTVISFTTMGQVSTGAAPWKVDFSSSVPRCSVMCCASVAADFLCGDTCLACIRQLVCMFAVKNDARARGLQNEGDELRQLAVAEDRGDGKFSNIQLIEDLARGGERLNEYGFRVTHVFRYDVEIFQRQGEIFRKRAVVRNDAQHRAPGTMRLQAAPAERAQRLVAIGG